MSFTLTRKEGPKDDSADKHVWPIEVECTAGTPVEIFVYTRGVGPTVGLNDRFSCVASALQLRTLPVNNPTTDEAGNLVPFFRKSKLRLDCHSADHAEYIWDSLLLQVAALRDNLASDAAMATTATVTI